MTNEEILARRASASYRLAQKLQNEAYRHGGIDAEDRWSDKKYREAGENSDAAREAVTAHINTLESELAALREERDREERLLRAGWRLDLAESSGSEIVHYFWMRNKLAFPDAWWVSHPDRAEAARMAEEKAK